VKLNNNNRWNTPRYALPEELRRRLIEASGYRFPTPAPDHEDQPPKPKNVIDLKQWRRRERAKDQCG
jgi:hypothetical protein